MTRHHPRPPLEGPPAGWVQRPDAPAPYEIPAQWLSSPSGTPVEASTYPRMWRSQGIRGGHAIRAMVLAVLGFLIAGIAAGAMTPLAFNLFRGAGDGWLGVGWRIELSLISLTINAIAFGLLVPFSFLLSSMVGQQKRWMHSVTGRFRWVWFLQCLAVGVVAVAAYAAAGALMAPRGNTGSMSGALWLLPVVLLLLVISVAGAEYMVRGVIFRGVASLSSSPDVGTVLGAVASSVVPVVLSAALFVYTRDVTGALLLLVVGLLAAFVVWQTGGLEAAVAVGVTHGLASQVPLLVTGMDDAMPLVSGPADFVRHGLVALVVLIIVLLARVRGVQRITESSTVNP